MKKILIILLLFFTGCTKEIVITESETRGKIKEVEQKKESVLTIKNLEAKKHFIQGMTYALEHQPEKAIIEFQEALIFENNPNINFALAVQFYKLNKLDLSIIYLERALAIPDSEIQPDFLLVAAQIYLSKRDLNQALNQLERLIKIDSTNIHALYNFAQLIEGQNKEKAKNVYEKILAIEPENRFATEALLNYYYEKYNYEKSEQLLKNLIFNEPYDVDLRLRLVGLYREWGKDDSAKILLEEITERFPDNFLSKLYLVEIYINEKNYEKALEYSKEAIELKSENSTDNTLLYDYITAQSIKDSTLKFYVRDFLIERISSRDTVASVYLFLISILVESKEKSDELFSNIKLNDLNLQILKKFGQEFFIEGKYHQAIYVLEKIFNQLTEDFDVNVILGQAYLAIENYSKSVRYLKNSAEINSQNPELFVAISYSLGKLKQYDEAIEFAERALSIDDKNKNGFISLGLLFDDAGYFQKSDSLYEFALTIYPDDPTLLNNYAYSLAKRKVNLEKALSMSKKSLEKDSLISSYLDTLGWIYFQMGNLELAEYYVKLAINQGSPSAEILEHMGDIYLKMNKKEDAAEFYRMALKLDPENEDIQSKLNELK